MATTQNKSEESSSGLPDEYRPTVDKIFGHVSGAFDSGAFDHVEGFTGEQLDSFGTKKALGGQGGIFDNIAANASTSAGTFGDAAAGRGPLWGAGATQGLKNAAVDDAQKALGATNSGLAGAGAIGGVRGALLKADNERQLANTFAELDYQDLSARRQGSLTGAQGAVNSAGALQNAWRAGADLTGEVGDAIQQQKQNEADGTLKGINAAADLIGKSGFGSQTNTEGQSKTK